MAKWYDQYLTKSERNNLQVGQKGIRARTRKKRIENQDTLGNPTRLRQLNQEQTSLGNPKGLRDLEKTSGTVSKKAKDKLNQKDANSNAKKVLQDAFSKKMKGK